MWFRDQIKWSRSHAYVDLCQRRDAVAQRGAKQLMDRLQSA